MALACSGATFAQPVADWPKGPIVFVAPFSPGGGGDTLVRLFGTQLSKTLGTPVVVENRPGAGGNIGTAAVARSAPDGNTVVFGTNATMGTNLALYKNPGYTLNDFVPVAEFGSTALALVVSKESPFHSIADVIAHAKKHPKELTCASGGNGTASHMACVLLQQLTDVQITHIPYKGTSTAVVDIRTGRVTFSIDVLPFLMPYIKDGSVRALAVSTKSRVPAIGDVPTISEGGVAGYEFFTWDGIFAPKGTPEDRQDVLHAAMLKVNNDPAFRQMMADRGTVVSTRPRKEFAEFVRAEHARMQALVKKTGITID